MASRPIEPSPGLGGNDLYMPNILSVFNEEQKDIFQIRVNPVLTIGGLKMRIAAHYRLKSDDIAIIFNNVMYRNETKEERERRDDEMLKGVSRTPSPKGSAKHNKKL